MKKYFKANKFLFFLAIVASAVYAALFSVMAIIIKDIVDSATSLDLNRFYRILVITVIYLVLFFASYIFYSVSGKKLIVKILQDISNDVFDGIFNKDIQDYKSINSADYLSSLTNDIKLVEENYLLPFLTIINNAFIFIAAFVIMVYYSPLVMLILAVSIIILLIVPNFFKNMLAKRQSDLSSKLSTRTTAIKDYLLGFEVIRSFGMHSHISKSYKNENASMHDSKYSLDKGMAIVEAVSMALGLLLQFGVMFVSGYLIITGKLTAGLLVALVQVSGSIVSPVQLISQCVPKMKGTKPIIIRLNDFTNVSLNNTFKSKLALPTFTKNIELKSLEFGYSEDKKIIKSIDFSFIKNRKYAIVGKSGCGKTTLINLLNGYYANYSGQILYDNTEIKNLDILKLNEMSAVIHQNVYMFDETIKNNICLHKDVKDNDLNYALTISGVDSFINDIVTLDSYVGENGNKLSGGQRQRVAVARALVQKKPILILDEGTSAIDKQTAFDIENRLLQADDLTMITITHSLSPELLKLYDTVIFMEDGQIIASGSFNNLISTSNKFNDFYNLRKKPSN